MDIVLNPWFWIGLGIGFVVWPVIMNILKKKDDGGRRWK